MKDKDLHLIILLIFTTITFSFGQFSNELLISGKTKGAYSVYSCDIDNDGDNDVISASNNDDKVQWFENTDGMGTFNRSHLVTTNIFNVSEVYAADLDNDGDYDILSSSSSDHTLAWYENIDGNGKIWDQKIISDTLQFIHTLHVEDIDLDNDPDIFAACASSGVIVWYENNGSAVFDTSHVCAQYVGQTYDIKTADMDNDGDKDLITCGTLSDLAWCENTDGYGNFGAMHVISTSSIIHSVFATDLKGYGCNDVVGGAFSGEIVYYKNNCNGNFGFPISFGTNLKNATSIDAADLDNDGDIDLVNSFRDSSSIVIYINDGYGNFSFSRICSNVIYAEDVYVSDIDGDSLPDVLSASSGDGKIVWFKNYGNCIFSEQKVVSSAESFGNFSFVDIDGDNWKDIVGSVFKSIVWHRNNGDGTFNPQVEICDSFRLAKTVLGMDVDNDGDYDILASSTQDEKVILCINDNGIFNNTIEVAGSLYNVGPLASTDFDNDNDIDFICNQDNNKLLSYQNDGLGNFTLKQIITTSVDDPTSIYTGDLDGDNDNDLLVSSWNDDKIAWCQNDGFGNFGALQIISSVANGASWVYAKDLDGDGDLDVLSASCLGNTVEWYINDGYGNFGAAQIIQITERPTSVYASDLDGDGDNDVVVTSGWDDEVFWNENLDGAGNFSSKKLLCDSTEYPLFVTTDDFDHDGDQDIFYHTLFNYDLLYFENYYHSKYQVKGNCYYDENQNGQKDSLETGLEFITTELSPNELAAFSNSAGDFWFAVDTGAYLLSYSPVNYWGLATDSTEFHVVLTDTTPLFDSLFFGFYPDTIINDLNVSLTGGQSRCDNDMNYWINIINHGTTRPDGIIELSLDPQLTYVSSLFAPDSINGQSYYWSIDSLFYFSEKMIDMILHTPDFNSMGDTLQSVVNVYVSDTGGTYVFSDTLIEVHTCAYDPNDKLVSPKGFGQEGIVPLDEVLEYTVRFQNTGNDTAINIKIRDRIDERLDLSSLHMLGSSHQSFDVYIEQNHWLVFQFDSIMLPDSTANFPGSQGFVKYSIAIDSTTLPNEKIYNTANIYFDNNPTVSTNTVVNTVECYIAPIPPDIYQSGSDLYVSTSNEIQWYLNDTILFNATDTLYTALQNGDYMVQVTDANGCSSFSDVYTYIGVGLEEYGETFTFAVYPNPTTGMIHFQIQGNVNIEKVEVLDIKGNLIYTNTKLLPIDLSQQAKGVYFVKVIAMQGVVIRKVVLE